MEKKIIIVHAPDEDNIAKNLADALSQNGYKVIYRGSLLPGDSYLNEYNQNLLKDLPVIFCGTCKACGSIWASRILNAAKARNSTILPAKLDDDANIEVLFPDVDGIVIADCRDTKFDLGIKSLLKSLEQLFSLTQSENDKNPLSLLDTISYLDRITTELYYDDEEVTSFREKLRDDIRKKNPSTKLNRVFLKDMGLLINNRLTLAGALLFGNQYKRNSWMAITKCSKYDSNNISSGTAVKKLDLDEPVHRQIEKSLEFIKSNSYSYEVKIPNKAQQQIVYQYPMECVEEIIANAICHRDYQITDRSVHVRLFSDRLEVVSPGIWHGKNLQEGKEYSLEELLTEPKQRNPTLAHLIFAIKLSEGRGEGIPHSIRNCEEEHANIPTVKQMDGMVHVTIFPRRFGGKEENLLIGYLSDVIAGTSHIDIQGISSASGKERKPIRFPIEEHYTPLKTMSNPRELKETSMMDGKAFDEARRVPLTDLLSSCPRMLIVGEPGGGKTTFLRFIACVLAKDALGRDKPGRYSHLGLSLDEPTPIPILIRLSVLAGILKKGESASHGSSAWRVLVQAMEELFESETVLVLKGLLEEGRCALLLDGLDEEPDVNIREKMVEVTNAVLHHWGGNLIVITSRPFGYQAVAALEKMRKADVDAFSEGEILEFLSRWANALFPDEDERNRMAYLPELRSAVLNIPRIRRMAKNPVMLTCLCVVHWNEKKLPEGKADLLAAVLRWLINAKEEKRKARKYHNTFAVECFKALAFSMTNHPKGKQVSADLSWAAEQLKVPFRDELNVEDERSVRKRGMEFLEAETIDSGIIEQAGTGQVRFWHLTFQEHYAARALVELGEGDGKDGWWSIVKVHLYDRQWDEVIDHFVGCLAQIGRRGLNLLTERILNTTRIGDLTSIARVVGVLGRILHILDVYDYEPPQRLGWENIQRQVMDIFTPDGASRVPVEQRIIAAEALGGSGDPRFNSIDPEMLPIPGMPDVLLGKYPVTVQEYQRFIENGGYEEQFYWGEGWEIKIQKNWKEPSGWDEQTEHLNRPVTGVSWYEAGAYCSWLSKQTGFPYQLPTEEEWGKAATHPKGEYPWGDDQPNEELLNFNDNVGYPTPVGVYPTGTAPGGHLDMAGNVWEWIHDIYIDRRAYRVIRGGGWSSLIHFCRSAKRYSFWPDSRNFDIGFRLSRSIAL